MAIKGLQKGGNEQIAKFKDDVLITLWYNLT